MDRQHQTGFLDVFDDVDVTTDEDAQLKTAIIFRIFSRSMDGAGGR
jgi:hypothetical protein